MDVTLTRHYKQSNFLLSLWSETRKNALEGKEIIAGLGINKSVVVVLEVLPTKLFVRVTLNDFNFS